MVPLHHDNYDLNVLTPNGKRETHALAIELTQHPVEITTVEEKQIIPRLNSKEVKDLYLSDV